MASPKFASFNISGQIFFSSKLSYALVNLKPIVHGHVLVIPKRLALRVNDLSSDEASDLFMVAQRVGSRLEERLGARSLTFACQDGAFAGQSVPHVHMHILPRRPADFQPMDAIYEVLDRIEPLKIDDVYRKARTADEMRQEAELFASYFTKEEGGGVL